jgi:hypothetical protein
VPQKIGEAIADREFERNREEGEDRDIPDRSCERAIGEDDLEISVAPPTERPAARGRSS